LINSTVNNLYITFSQSFICSVQCMQRN